MKLIDIEMQMQLEPNFLKRMKWQAQVLLIKELLDAGNTPASITRVLGLSSRWISDALAIMEHWTIAKHAPSFQQASITVNARRAQLRRSKMEKLASEATSSPRTILR